uniref:Uncharacterized protein n=1 Tax=Anguilla anguilla TaxID=7936 RepID=A0A0E9V470_ANGAN
MWATLRNLQKMVALLNMAKL